MRLYLYDVLTSRTCYLTFGADMHLVEFWVNFFNISQQFTTQTDQMAGSAMLLTSFHMYSTVSCDSDRLSLLAVLLPLDSCDDIFHRLWHKNKKSTILNNK